MEKLKAFLFTTFLGGITVILPISITFFVFKWVFIQVGILIRPVTQMIPHGVGPTDFIANVVALSILIFICFIIGLIEKTSLGNFIYSWVEKSFLTRLPGYKVIKETIIQFTSNNKSPFSSVALVRIFENQTLATAFVTDDTDKYYTTVFIPTGPNPTSGLIYHLKKEFVHKIDYPVDSTMRSILSCGSGSFDLVNKYQQTKG